MRSSGLHFRPRPCKLRQFPSRRSRAPSDALVRCNLRSADLPRKRSRRSIPVWGTAPACSRAWRRRVLPPGPQSVQPVRLRAYSAVRFLVSPPASGQPGEISPETFRSMTAGHRLPSKPDSPMPLPAPRAGLRQRQAAVIRRPVPGCSWQLCVFPIDHGARDPGTQHEPRATRRFWFAPELSNT